MLVLMLVLVLVLVLTRTLLFVTWTHLRICLHFWYLCPCFWGFHSSLAVDVAVGMSQAVRPVNNAKQLSPQSCQALVCCHPCEARRRLNRS